MGDRMAWLALVAFVIVLRIWTQLVLGVLVGTGLTCVLLALATWLVTRRSASQVVSEAAPEAEVDVEDEPQPERTWMVGRDGVLVDDRGRRV